MLRGRRAVVLLELLDEPLGYAGLAQQLNRHPAREQHEQFVRDPHQEQRVLQRRLVQNAAIPGEAPAELLSALRGATDNNVSCGRRHRRRRCRFGELKRSPVVGTVRAREGGFRLA